MVPTLALADAPTETIALPATLIVGHRRIAAVHRASRSGPAPLASALFNALQEAAVRLGLTPVTTG